MSNKINFKDSLVHWTDENELKLNPAKTKKVSYYPKNKRRYNSHYYINASTIENQDTYKDLGITFDSQLTYDQHIHGVLTKSTRISALSYKFAKELRTPQLDLRIIYTYLVPILEYVSIIW